MKTRPFLLRGPAGLLGMLLFVVPVEGFVARHPDRFLTPTETDWGLSGLEASGAEARAEVLCFGDSMLKFGLSPTALGDALGRPVRSFALLDGKPAASYLLFRRAIESGARPGLVLVDFQPECLAETSPHQLEKRHWSMLLSARESLEMFGVYRDADFLARTLLAGALPSLRCRDQVRLDLTLALKAEANPNPGENGKALRNRRVHAGGLVLPRRPDYAGEVADSYHEVLYDRDWFHRPEHTRFIRLFMALARDHGIPVVWVLPPNVPGVEEARLAVGLHERYSDLIRSVQVRYPNVRVVDARLSGYGPESFYDPVHLNAQGASAFSLEVAEAVRPVLEGGGRSAAAWVRLGRDRPGASGRPLEDVEQSLIISRGAGGPVRR